VAGSTNNQT